MLCSVLTASTLFFTGASSSAAANDLTDCSDCLANGFSWQWEPPLCTALLDCSGPCLHPDHGGGSHGEACATPPSSSGAGNFTSSPTMAPSSSPSESPTSSPSESPTSSPSESPTSSPSESPTSRPTPSPTIAQPTAQPTLTPTPAPTENPTVVPSPRPTPSPTGAPSPQPSESPTARPSESPTARPTPSPTTAPTPSPTPSPTTRPTPMPTASPTPAPTPAPTPSPTTQPTPAPTPSPTTQPTPAPTTSPTNSPTVPETREKPFLNRETLIYIAVGAFGAFFLIAGCLMCKLEQSFLKPKRGNQVSADALGIGGSQSIGTDGSTGLLGAAAEHLLMPRPSGAPAPPPGLDNQDANSQYQPPNVASRRAGLSYIPPRGGALSVISEGDEDAISELSTTIRSSINNPHGALGWSRHELSGSFCLPPAPMPPGSRGNSVDSSGSSWVRTPGSGTIVLDRRPPPAPDSRSGTGSRGSIGGGPAVLPVPMVGSRGSLGTLPSLPASGSPTAAMLAMEGRFSVSRAERLPSDNYAIRSEPSLTEHSAHSGRLSPILSGTSLDDSEINPAGHQRDQSPRGRRKPPPPGRRAPPPPPVGRRIVTLPPPRSAPPAPPRATYTTEV